MKYIDKILPVEFFSVSGILFMKELPDRVIKVAFGSLQPGMQISKVGKPGRTGVVTSGNRVDQWQPWIQYEGKIKLQCPDVAIETDCIVFKLPPGGMLNADGSKLLFGVYVIYMIIDEGNLMRNQYTQAGSVRLFSSVFKEYKTGKIYRND